MERRLAAILAADVVGYSRLMGVDEAATLAALNAHRKELVDAKITEHQGRTVKLTGDGMLVEFPSVVNAVACAVAVQRGMAERNAGISPDRRIEFRIGVNLGDVIVEGDDIFGDGVNVAARLEGIAAPGGIAVSGTVLDHIGNRLDVEFEDIGDQTLKNMERPVRVWRWVTEPTAAAPSGEPLALPDRPSIAVLPFDNLSGQPEETYFSDGITEDIITGLARFRSLFVIARNSSFAFRGKSLDLTEIGRKLGVSFILEGSVRRAGQRVRITAQFRGGKRCAPLGRTLRPQHGRHLHRPGRSCADYRVDADQADRRCKTRAIAPKADNQSSCLRLLVAWPGSLSQRLG